MRLKGESACGEIEPEGDCRSLVEAEENRVRQVRD